MATLKHEKGRTVDVPQDRVDYFVNKGWTVDVVVASTPAAFPDGDPSEDWTAKELDAYADHRGIDLGGATKKADKVAAIAAATD